MKIFGGRYTKDNKGNRTGKFAFKSVLLICMVLIFGTLIAVGGTLAYLQQRSGVITNTFQAGEITYTLTLKANVPTAHEGDIKMPSELTPSQSTSLSVAFTTDKTPELAGYTFGGWFIDDGCNTKYEDVSGNIITVKYGSSIDSNSDANKVEITLYAQWTANSYYIVYDANGGSGSMEKTTATYDANVALRENSFTRAGYSFNGWNTAADGSGTPYKNQATVSNLSAENGAKVTLYAQWTANADTRYRVEHYQQNVDDDGYTLADTENLTGTTDTEVTPKVRTYTGFTSPAAQTEKINGDGSTVIKYYYDRNYYTVTLNKGTGISSVSGAGSYRFGKSVTIKATVADGYQWKDWTGTESVSDQTYDFTMPAANVEFTANAEVINYTITYVLNNGSVSGNPTTYTVETETFTLNNPTRIGYTFGGWTGTGLGSADTSVTISKGSTGNRSYTANWTPNTNTPYRVEHYQQNVDDDGYTLADTENLTGTTDTEVTPTVNTYEGFTSPVAQTEKINGDGSTVIKYYYDRNYYTVTLNKGTGISSVSGAGSYRFGETVEFNAIVKDGYAWVKWTGTKSVSDQAYDFTMPAANVEFTAHAEVIDYDISYYLFGGSVSGNPTTYTVETNTFTLKNPTRNGFTFGGWTGTGLDSANTSVEISKGSTGDRSYTATWTANSYYIVYDANGGSGSMSDQSFKYDTAQKLTSNEFTKTGYTFIGWNTAADGSGTAYADQAYVLSLSAENGAEVTLYAQWKVNTYTVALYSNLLYGLQDTVSEVVSEGIKYTIKDKAITGTGINENAPSDCYGYTSARVMLDAGKEYRFTADCDGTFGSYNSDVEVRFMLNGIYDPSTRLKTTSTDCKLTTPISSGEYHMRYEVNYLGETHTLSNINVAENIGSIEVTYGSDYSGLNKPQRQGYTFTKWLDLDENAYTTSTKVTKTEDHTLFAQWEPNQYTVVFDANGGEGSMSTQTFTYDIAQALTANAFTKDGCGFTGWNTKADGSGTGYENVQEVKNLAEDGSVLLYAQWISQNYSIQFNANGGSGTMNDISAVYDQETTLTANTFAREGYTFVGWNTKADGTGITYADHATVKNLPSTDGDVVVLYAQWNKLSSVILIYDANGGTNAPETQLAYVASGASYTFGITSDIPIYISSSGISYQFLGWSEDNDVATAVLQYSADGSNKENPEEELSTSVTVEHKEDSSTKTLYAIWGVTYRLSYNAGSGSGVPDPVEHLGRLTGYTFTVDSSTTPAWTDHDFKYWTTNVHYVTGEENDTTVMYPQSSKITLSPAYSDVTLYARYYNKGALTVTYNANVPYLGVAYDMPGDATITADVDGDSVPYSISYALNPTVKLSGSGTAYNLLGWATSPDATEAEYTVGQQVQLSRYNDQATVLYAVWDVVPIVVCIDLGDESISVNSSGSDKLTDDGYYWNDRCVVWATRTATESPASVRAKFYLSWVNSKSDKTIIGFSGIKNGTDCDVYDLVDRTTGNVYLYVGSRDFYLTEALWNSKTYNPETKAYFIPIYAVLDRYVYVTVKLNYNNPEFPDRSSYIISPSHDCYVASIYESGNVSERFIYQSRTEFVSKNFWVYQYSLRDGSEYAVSGWAWDADATTPEGTIIAVNTGEPPVYAESGSVNTHLCYNSEISLNVNDKNYTTSTNSYGVTTYTYTVYVIYGDVTNSNTFKILLDYNDGSADTPNGDLDAKITQGDSYTYASSTGSVMRYDCNDDKCLNSNAYEIVGWSLSRDNLNLDLLQYPVGHAMNGSIAQEAVYAATAPLTVSTEDAYDAEGNFYYKLFYAVYAKTLNFDGNFSGAVSNMPASISAYTHYGFEGDTTSITIPSNIPTRAEALFLGWATEPDGEVVYQPGDNVTVTSATTTLYAVWQKNYTFTLTYNWNYEGGSSFSELNYSNTVSHIEIAIVDSIPSRNGYTFLGWAETPDATVPAYTNPAQAGTEATITVTATVPNQTTVKTLYAVWQENVSETSADDEELATQSDEPEEDSVTEGSSTDEEAGEV